VRSERHCDARAKRDLSFLTLFVCLFVCLCKMKFAAAVLAVLSVVGLANAQEELKSLDEFKALGESGKHAFVKFYAPW